MKPLNVGRFAGAVAAVFIAAFALGYVIHELLLKSFYQMTEGIWRPAAQIASGRYVVAMAAGYLLYAVMFVWIYHFGFQGRKWDGLRYGFYMWLLTCVAATLVIYSVQPLGEVALWWIVLGLPDVLILGLITSAIYKPKEA